MKEIKKIAILTQANNERVKMVAYQSSSGAVSDYIQRYLPANPNQTQQQLKTDLSIRFIRFGDITDACACCVKHVRGATRTFNVTPSEFWPWLRKVL